MRGYGVRPAAWAGAVGVVLLAMGYGGWQLMEPAESTDGPAIVVGTTKAAVTLDPAAGYDGGSWALYSNVFQSLLTFVPGQDEPVPDAAESCRFSDGTLRRYTCVLRDDVKFSNGRAMTAYDVQFSFERTLHISDDRAPTALLENIKSVRAKDRTVRFELKNPDAIFPFKIASAAGAILDSEHYPPDTLREDDTLVGSGPYRLVSYEAGEQVELEPNPHYSGVMPSASSPILIRYFATPRALSAAWKNREVDVNDGHIPPAELAALPPHLEAVTESDGVNIRTMVFDVRSDSVMARRAVRQAAALLLDRERLVDKVYQGTVDPLYSLIPEGITGHAVPFQDAYPASNVERAKQLMREAGVQTPVSFELAYSQGPAVRQEAEMLGEQLEAGGLFKVTTKHYEWNDFSEGMAKGKFDAYTLGWTPDYPDPDTYTWPLVGTDNATMNGYSNPTVDALAQRSQRHTNRSATDADYKKVQEMVAKDVPIIPLWQANDYVLSSPAVSGAQYLRDYNGLWALWQLTRN